MKVRAKATTELSFNNISWNEWHHLPSSSKPHHVYRLDFQPHCERKKIQKSFRFRT